MLLSRSAVALALAVTACGAGAPGPRVEAATLPAPCPSSPPQEARPVPIDAPKAASSSPDHSVFSVILRLDGTALVDGVGLPGDDAILQLARDAHATNGDVRAVIAADASITHGRVVHVLDLLKQAGLSRIAFAVTQAP